MYSQNNEEIIIGEFFYSKGIYCGRFLDIGAYDGKTFSNTYKLATMGWSGVCYEPSPKPFAALKKLYDKNGKIVVVNSAVGAVSGATKFYDSNGNAVSTTDINHRNKWEKGSAAKFNEITVSCESAQDVVRKYGAVYDFVNIDTEGTNFETLKLFIAAKLKFKLLCIEHDGLSEQIIQIFPGCKKLSMNGENIILSR